MKLINPEIDYKDWYDYKEVLERYCKMFHVQLYSEVDTTISVSFFPSGAMAIIPEKYKTLISQQLYVATIWAIQVIGVGDILNKHRFTNTTKLDVSGILHDINQAIYRYEVEERVDLQEVFLGVLTGNLYLIPEDLEEQVRKYELERELRRS